MTATLTHIRLGTDFNWPNEIIVSRVLEIIPEKRPRAVAHFQFSAGMACCFDEVV